MSGGQKNVLIIGGGASGMAAAIAAARAGAQVTILEKEEKLGRKLLATGNGRCNLSNVGTTQGSYRGMEPAFAEKVLEGFSVEETLAFFRGLGLYMTVESERVYPYSGQAETVLHTLLRELTRLGVRIKCGEEIISADVSATSGRMSESIVKKKDRVERSAADLDPFSQAACSRRQHDSLCGSLNKNVEFKENCFIAFTKTWKYTADSLILACGTFASLGKKQLPYHGFSLAEAFGHSLRKTVPALGPLKVAEAGSLGFAGVRLRGSVSVFSDGEKIAEDTGQLQLTDNGISGIPVFNVSGAAARNLLEGKKVTAELDFLPDLPEEETASFLLSLQEPFSHESPGSLSKAGKSGDEPKARELLRGIFPERLVRSILKCFPEREPSREELARAIRHFPLTVTGTAGEGYAQVLSGGVLTKDVNPATCESCLVPGLYLTGEMLDIDGICGGFNLQFAWSTGILAGRAAGNPERDSSSE